MTLHGDDPDLTAGQLSIDGTDARARSPEEVRALLAWSPEQPTLFPASLRAKRDY